MHKLYFVIAILLWVNPLFAKNEEGYSGPHVGVTLGGGLTAQDGDFNQPAALSFNLEGGYNFGNSLDIIGRVGFSPLIGADEAVTNSSGVIVTPDNLVKIYTYDAGLRYIPPWGKVKIYGVILLGAYTSSNSAATSSIFRDQTGFHNVNGVGVDFKITDHHSASIELDTHLFLNKESNLLTTVFSAGYRYMF